MPTLDGKKDIEGPNLVCDGGGDSGRAHRVSRVLALLQARSVDHAARPRRAREQGPQ